MQIIDFISIAVGLALTYTIMSLIASALKEGLSSFLKLRSSQLETVLQGIVTNDIIPAVTTATIVPATFVAQGPVQNQPAIGPRSTQVASNSNASAPRGRPAFQAVYDHPLVRNAQLDAKPNYIPTRNFTLALLSALGNGRIGETTDAVKNDIRALPDGALRQTLTALVSEADLPLESAKSKIDAWFDGAMGILTDEYRVFAQKILFLIGLGLAIALNVDTVRIVATLASSANTRAEMVAIAQSTVKTSDATTQSPFGSSIEALKKLPIPLGWPECGEPMDGNICPGILKSFEHDGVVSIVMRLIGWLLTAAAISLGAPFWFDLLNQLVGRNGAKEDAGPKSDASSI